MAPLDQVLVSCSDPFAHTLHFKLRQVSATSGIGHPFLEALQKEAEYFRIEQLHIVNVNNVLKLQNVGSEPCQITEQYQQIPSPYLAFAPAKSEGFVHHRRHQNTLR